VPGASEARDGLVFGVAAGLSARFGISLPVVRAAFATLAAAGGFGLVLYLVLAAAWRSRPNTGEPPSDAHDLGAGLLTAGLVWELGHWWPGVRPELVVPVGLVTVGVAMGWRSGAPSAADLLSRPRAALVRVAGGLVLCIGGLGVLLGQRVDLATFRDTGLALAVAFAGAALVLGPSAVRFARSFSLERDERIRAQERAVVAAHLHDSVLQTLTLIQKRADDPAATASLARHQERSLRRWLYGGGVVDPTGEVDPGETGWRGAAERMAGEVEDRYAIVVDLVVVGDGDVALDSQVATALAAAREALVNAAKFSGETRVSIYCEHLGDRFEVYVRDRGKGFVLRAVGADRHGIRDSIVGRVAGAGGSATIRTDPGAGTEVHLWVPVDPEGGLDR
jgi:signal transduction histidine kinase